MAAEHVNRWRGAYIEWQRTAPEGAPPPPPPPPDPGVSGQDVLSRLFARVRETRYQPTFSAPPPEPGIATVTLPFVSPDGTVRSSVSGLKWAFYTSTNFPDFLLDPPASTGTDASLNAQGQLSITIEDTTMQSGETGWLIITNSDGTAEQDPPSLAFCAPVVVD